MYIKVGVFFFLVLWTGSDSGKSINSATSASPPNTATTANETAPTTVPPLTTEADPTTTAGHISTASTSPISATSPTQTRAIPKTTTSTAAQITPTTPTTTTSTTVKTTTASTTIIAIQTTPTTTPTTTTIPSSLATSSAVTKPSPTITAKTPTSSAVASRSSSRATSNSTAPMTAFYSSTTVPSTHPSIKPSSDKEPTPATVFGLFLSVICVVVVAGLLILFLWRKRKDSYVPYTWRSYKGWLSRKRQRSTSGSQGPLTMDDTASIDLAEPKPERELFSIGDQDGGEDGRRNVTRTRARRSTDADDYFYDEIFERSAFVDERTNKSNTHLTIESDDDDELDIPDLVFKKPSGKY